MTVARLVCRQFCLVSLFSVLSLLSGPVTANSTDQLPLIAVGTTTLSPVQIGLSVGREAKKLIPDLERRYDAYLAAIISQTAFDHIANDDLPALIKRQNTAYQQELKGVAAAWQLAQENRLGDSRLSLQEYWLLNVMSDFRLGPDSSGFGVMGSASAESGPIVGVNQDWQQAEHLKPLQVIHRYEHADRVVVTIGFAGIVSALIGFNDQGLLLAYSNAEPQSPYRVERPLSDQAHSIGFALREVLSTADTNKKARQLVSKKEYAMDNSILMADAQSVQVLEYSVEGGAHLRTWRSALQQGWYWERREQIALVACHLLEKSQPCRDIKDTLQWQRFRTLAQFDQQQPAEIEDISAILLDTANDHYEIFNANTVNSLVHVARGDSFYMLDPQMRGELLDRQLHRPYLEALSMVQPPVMPHEQSSAKTLVIWGLLIAMLGVVLWAVQLPGRSQKESGHEA